MAKSSQTLAAYAKHRGVAKQSVQTMIASGRLTEASVEKLKNGSYRVDFEKADAELEANTAVGHGGDRSRAGPVYSESRAVRETYAARIAKVDYEEKIGKLATTDGIRREAHNLGQRLRDAVLNVPHRISGPLCAMTAEYEIRELLERELRTALDDLLNA